MLARLKMAIKYFLWKNKAKRIFRKSNGLIRSPIRIKNPQYFYIGKHCRVDKQSRIECLDTFSGERLQPKLILEEGVIVGIRCVFWVTNELKIGKDTILANDILITTENHGINPEINIPYHAQPLISKPVIIGSNCWIGAHAIILPGVSIGNNCVVGAGSVVTKSFPSNSIIAGNPASLVKKYDFDLHKWIRNLDS